MESTGCNTGAAKVAGWLLAVVSLVLPISAQEAALSRDLAPLSKPSRLILVSIPDRKLAVVEDGEVIRTFPVAVGADVSPSPTGNFQIVKLLTDPTYYHPGVVIPPGSTNPIGPRWIGLNKKGYGIHGTNEPRSIGKAASHGCIRLRNRDVVQFSKLVAVGDTVEIRAERDEQIARIFGAESREATEARLATAPLAAGGGQ